MHIVALDAQALNPGDLSWDAVEAHGKLEIHARSAAGEVADRARHADIAITNKVPFDAARLAALPGLRMIAVTATGYNIIDVAAAKARGVVVCNVPAYSTESVAQHVFALLLEMTNAVGVHAESVRSGEWAAAADFAYWKRPLVELAGKKLGIVGLGAIGRKVAAIGHAMGMEVLVHRRRGAVAEVGYPVRGRTLEEVFAESDVVSLHCPLTKENAGFVNSALLSRMKRTAYLINTARGGLVVEADVAAALNAGAIAGFAADVLTMEPPAGGSPLIGAKNCVLTPHVAWATLEARRRCMAMTAGNIAAFIAGRPVNVVNP
jgi:glycerate dehydrogenase